jgi:hypothetical protein
MHVVIVLHAFLVFLESYHYVQQGWNKDHDLLY